MSKFSWLKYLALAAALLGATVDAQADHSSLAPSGMASPAVTTPLTAGSTDHSSLTSSSTAPATVTTALTAGSTDHSSLTPSNTAPTTVTTAHTAGSTDHSSLTSSSTAPATVTTALTAGSTDHSSLAPYSTAPTTVTTALTAGSTDHSSLTSSSTAPATVTTALTAGSTDHSSLAPSSTAPTTVTTALTAGSTHHSSLTPSSTAPATVTTALTTGSNHSSLAPYSTAPTTVTTALTAGSTDHPSVTPSSTAPATVTTALTTGSTDHSSLAPSSTAPTTVNFTLKENSNDTLFTTSSTTSTTETLPLSENSTISTGTNGTATGFPAATVTSAPNSTIADSKTTAGDQDCENVNIIVKEWEVINDIVKLHISYKDSENLTITILNSSFALVGGGTANISVSLPSLSNCAHYTLNGTFSGKCNHTIELVNIITNPSPDLQFHLNSSQSGDNITFQLKTRGVQTNCKLNYTWNCHPSTGNKTQISTEVMTFQNLTPCQTYHCFVKIQQVATKWYQTRKSNTTADYEKPKKPIVNVKPGQRKITVNWSVSHTKMQPVKKINITSTPKGCSTTKDIMKGDRTGSYACKNLAPYERYTIHVTANNNKCNNENQSSEEEIKHVQTNSEKPATPQIKNINFLANNEFELSCTELDPTKFHGPMGRYLVTLTGAGHTSNSNNTNCKFVFKDLNYLTTYKIELVAHNGQYGSERVSQEITTKYNDKALIGFLVFLIIATSIALAIVLYKIYILQRKSSRRSEESVELITHDDEKQLLNMEPILAEQLIDVYRRKQADESRLFLAEFQSIPRVFSKFSVKEARRGCNTNKNRYVDILPYDHNRVQLSPIAGEQGSDYINASFIDGFNESRKYIAAQGPKEETSDDFWKMVWEQKATIIVMVTRCEEGKRPKCAQYWPTMDSPSKTFGDLTVRISEEQWCPDYVIRKLFISHKSEKTPEREVTHIQFIRWPDHGVPEDPHLLLKLRQRVNAFRNLFSGPIVVHCSAGVGRTGSYIGIDAMMQGLEAEGRVDVYGYIVQLRRQRCLMVQVEAQYILIHQALLEYYLYGETEVSLSELPKHLINFKKNDPPSEPSMLEGEFQRIPPYTDWRTQTTGRRGENQSKNRSLSVIAYDYNRVTIKLEDEKSKDSTSHSDSDLSSDDSEDEESTKYINASYIDGYWHSETLIATQTPLPETIADFWMMVYQRKARIIAMLGKLKDDKDCSQYWEDDKKTYDDIEVVLSECNKQPEFIVRIFEIRHTKRKETRQVYQYHFHDWAESELPEDPSNFTKMIRSIKEKLSTLQEPESSLSPSLIVHCSDGAKKTGVFYALWILLDNADTENVIDVLQTVKVLRKQRPGLVSTFEQYQFLYDIIASTYPVQNGTLISDNGPAQATIEVISEISPENEFQPKAASDSTKNEEESSAQDDEAKSGSSNDKQPAENPINGPVTSGAIE
ncbi:receptor-type tyrosine-protein phosphatase C isoform X8 [Heterodontus francisci]|uniref:receptor-type tyrosine-protein phosphatase C isoform X8 n=1 Tax=Heterodontus francisci TaxID=7792 RepID=UPI00355BA613